MKQKTLGIFMLFVGMLLSVSFAHADQLAASHTLVSQQQTANGSAVTLNITVTNQTGSALNGITLDMIDLTLWANPGTNMLTVGSLSAGGSTSLVWSITSSASSFIAGPPLSVLVNAIDSNGQTIEFPILSAGE